MMYIYIYICVCINIYVRFLWNHNPPGGIELEPTITYIPGPRFKPPGAIVEQYDDPDAPGYRDPKELEDID